MFHIKYAMPSFLPSILSSISSDVYQWSTEMEDLRLEEVPKCWNTAPQGQIVSQESDLANACLPIELLALTPSVDMELSH